MLMAGLLVAVGLVILTLGAEGLVRGSAGLAARLGVPSFVIGITVVGFGTSTPELSASVMAALRGSSDLAVGNVVGSNIFNLAVILGVVAVLKPIPIRLAAVRVELGWMVAAALVPLLGLLDGGRIGPALGGVLVGLLVVYTVRGVLAGRRHPDAPAAVMEGELGEMLTPAASGRGAVLREIGLSIAGLAALVVGAGMLVDGAVRIAVAAGMNELVIGLTIVAAGTSLPELATSITAARRGKPDLALGNVLGSNVFNTIGILGFASIVRPQEISRQAMVFDTPVMILVSVVTAVMCVTGARITRREGIALLLAYVAYVVVLLTLAPRWFA